MGEPQPGDFPDPINIKTDNVLLKAEQTGKVGGYVRADNATDPISWEVLTTTIITRDGESVLGGAIAQLQEDVTSVGKLVNTVNAAVFGVGSWLYGIANAALRPNDYVMLSRKGTAFGFENIRKLSTTSVARASNVITVTTRAAHGLKVGDTVTLSGFVPVGLNITGRVASITDEDTFTINDTGSAETATTQGLASTPVLANHAHAQFIKKSGATYNQGAAADDICVFSMLRGGMTQV